MVKPPQIPKNLHLFCIWTCEVLSPSLVLVQRRIATRNLCKVLHCVFFITMTIIIQNKKYDDHESCDDQDDLITCNADPPSSAWLMLLGMMIRSSIFIFPTQSSLISLLATASGSAVMMSTKLVKCTFGNKKSKLESLFAN